MVKLTFRLSSSFAAEFEFEFDLGNKAHFYFIFDNKIILYEAASTFGITLDQVNWLGNVISVMYLVFAPIVPSLCRRLGLRACVSLFLRSFFHGLVSMYRRR